MGDSNHSFEPGLVWRHCIPKAVTGNDTAGHSAADSILGYAQSIRNAGPREELTVSVAPRTCSRSSTRALPPRTPSPPRPLRQPPAACRRRRHQCRRRRVEGQLRPGPRGSWCV